MRKILLFMTVLFAASIAAAGPKSKKELNLATFNVRYQTPKDTGVRNWDARKSACVACIRDERFDVVGLQEVREQQQQDLREMMPEYAFEFVGRDNGTKGEAVGIAYRKDRLKALESGRFWLSPTPETPSNAMAWGGPERHRVAIWIKFEDLKTKKRFYYLSTHLEVNGQNKNVRSESASLIISKEQEINKEGLPFFVVGDLNPTNQEEEVLVKLRGYFIDSYHKASDDGTRYGPTGTYNGFNPDADLSSPNKKGDYIFGKGKYTLNRYEAVTKKYDGQYPSDHLAVVVNIIL